ncbi:hypothetical protein M440DRAFT_1422195 [Trichoderma longibrachiatum ATCC 18648]|uniref:Uncharacterized protein n=1 Tax=Trichoderma longibrachiatum ATCC 18648 TaxID=983965 RepID=A0A2T4C3A1_TRILO|nr:hypothetical protein M440DRAFT_1422195 [Trichoderma longibrachiatum ATCC 18648]
MSGWVDANGPPPHAAQGGYRIFPGVRPGAAALMHCQKKDEEASPNARQRAGFCLALPDLMARSSVMQRHFAWALARWLFFRRATLQEPTSLAVIPLGVPASYFPGRTTWGIKHGRIASPASCAALGEMALTRASVDDQRLVQDLFLTSPDRTSSSGSRSQRHTFIGHHETSSLQKYEYY